MLARWSSQHPRVSERRLRGWSAPKRKGDSGTSGTGSSCPTRRSNSISSGSSAFAAPARGCRSGSRNAVSNPLRVRLPCRRPSCSPPCEGVPARRRRPPRRRQANPARVAGRQRPPSPRRVAGRRRPPSPRRVAGRRRPSRLRRQGPLCCKGSWASSKHVQPVKKREAPPERGLSYVY